MNILNKGAAALAAVAMVMAGAALAQAQDYPDRPVSAMVS